MCQSDNRILIVQAPYATEIVASVLSKDWATRLKSGVKHSILLPAGTEYKAALVAERSFDLPCLTTAKHKYGFKSILCGFMHLGLWTPLDLMPSLIHLSHFKLIPSKAHL